jgi:NAD(P)-dependent dehydrogenase (short-subunit alcohol dehydrogenase family)
MLENPMKLIGKRILITGASSGIGQATAKLSSRLGGKVVLVARDEGRLEETFKSLSGDGHAYYVYDLTDIDNVPGLLKKIAIEQGKLSGMFHSAGITSVMHINIIKKNVIDQVFDINIKAALMLAKGFNQKVVRDDGYCSLVFMSSVAGICGVSGMSVYSASKAAVDGAVRSLACELASNKIRVNSISAGAVHTRMLDGFNVNKLSMDEIKKYENKHLLGFGEAEDIANAAAFLLSDASKWITGTCLVVDGGYSCP